MSGVVRYSKDVNYLAFNVVADPIGKAMGMNPTYTLAAVADTGHQCSFSKRVDSSVYLRRKVSAQALALVFIPLCRF